MRSAPFLVLLLSVSMQGLQAQAEWQGVEVPGPIEGEGDAWYRAWVKVPGHWTVMTGRPLYRESVTITIKDVAEVHEVFVNGVKIGGGGEFPPTFSKPKGDGVARYKVPPGSLVKDQWNELVVRIYNREGAGGFLGEAPSIQGYFLECILRGAWEIQRGVVPVPTGRALLQRPARAAFDQFQEASRTLGEARELVHGARLTPEESLKLMTTEDDLVIEELLTEPLVAQPTHLSFDDRGRLWVAQYRQYPYPAGLKQISRDKYYRAKYDQEPKAPPNHNRGRSRISVHEDTDGDGRYDKHKVFLDGLDLANAALPDVDGVWVMHTPYLLFYADRDRDDVPDGDPEVHLAGFGFEDAHSVANGLIWGPDGWIYGGQGSTVASRIRRPGLDGKNDQGVYFEGCMVWRYHPRRREFEIFAEGGGNVFGLEFDSEGRLFSGHNGGGTRGWHYVQGGYLLKQGRTPNKFGPAVNPYAFGDLAMMRSANTVVRFSHNTILCEGTAMPPRMQGRFLAADPLHHLLVLADRRKRGSTFETEDVGHPLKSSDPAFRPVYLCNAPDGSVYVADFYDYYIAHGQHYQSQIDPTTGRVYRLRGKEMERIRTLDLSALGSDALVHLLDHPNKWHRQMAVRLLGQRAPEARLFQKLRQWIGEHEGRAALDALWALAQAGGFDAAVMAECLRHPYPPVRAWTVRLLGDRPGEWEKAIPMLRTLAQSEGDLEVWSQLASTAQRIRGRDALPLIGELLNRSGDLVDPNLPLMLWWAIERHSGMREEILELFGDPVIWEQAMVRREILPRLMRRFAVTGREADLLVCASLLKLAPDAGGRAALMVGFEQAFAGGALPALPPALVDAIGAGGELSLILRVRRKDREAIAEAVTLVANVKAPRAERLRLIKTFGEMATGEAQAVLVALVHQEEGVEHDLVLRKAALGALQSYSAPGIAAEILKAYPELSGELRASAEALLASRAVWGRAWMDAVATGVVSKEGVAAEALASLRLHREERLSELVRSHFGEAKIAVTVPLAEVARIREAVDGAPGSPYRGRPLFKARCASCHVLFHSGGKIGPDLTNYQRDDLETMLASVVNPNAEIREGYDGMTVNTKDGRYLIGFVADEGAQAVVLRGFDGTEVALLRDQIVEMKPLGRSLMPEGLLEGLSDQELRDLFAYLRSAQPFLKD